MNGQHFRTFVWLNWRLRVNQFKKGGLANTIVFFILAAGAALLAVVLFVASFALGSLAFTEAQSHHIMWVFDGLVVFFIFGWSIGLLADLQRSEGLALSKFLHLPVSLASAFILNYLTSLVSFTMLLTLPALLGLGIGLAVARGPMLLLVFPLIAAFLLMVTAVSYQFQGWLASLMANKRRRRTIVVVITAAFVLVFQLPQLLNVYRPWQTRFDEQQRMQKEKLAEQLAGKITAEEFQKWNEEAQRDFSKENQQSVDRWIERIAITNLVLPPGWLPRGAQAAVEGDLLPVGLYFLGMTLIGGVSLWRGYRTTLRIYTGVYTGDGGVRPIGTLAPAAHPEPSAAPATAPANSMQTGAVGLLECKLPWISEQAAAVALATFRSLTRAPEVKMLLLTPLILGVIFGGMFFRNADETTEIYRPLLAFGGLFMIFFTMQQLIGNQFGYDRSGFRIYVLSPARRGDIILGKNLAVMPLALTLGLLIAGFIQVIAPMRIDMFLALFPQAISMYLLYCLLANCLSIIAPIPIAAGSFRPASSKLIPVLLHFAAFFLMPMVLAPTLLPWLVQLLLELTQTAPWAPASLALSLLECLGVIYFYRWLVMLQGQWLHARELTLLNIVVTKAE